MFAPRPDRVPPPACGGMLVGGETARASGLGEGARLMIGALATLGVAVRSIEAGLAVPGERAAAKDQPPAPPGSRWCCM